MNKTYRIKGVYIKSFDWLFRGVTRLEVRMAAVGDSIADFLVLSVNFLK